MIYILRSDGAYAVFTGMAIDDINAMLATQGLTCSEIDQATYEAATAVPPRG